jgi:glutathione-regulated potassium-efflux system ancillary protein KefG
MPNAEGQTPESEIASVQIIYAHPDPAASRVNKAMVKALDGAAGIHVHDLYAAYPDFYVDVKREKTMLLAADIIVLQHPMYWYSAPALMKEWIDRVLERGWAYGQGGTALQGKQMLSAITTGGPPEAYEPQGYNKYSIDEFMRPFEQTAVLCGIEWLPPFVFQGAYGTDDAKVSAHAQAYRAQLIALAGGSPGEGKS